MALNSGVGIVQNGLICHLDAGNIRSYPGFGTYWYDISGNSLTAIGQSGASYQNSNYSPSILYNGTSSAYHTLPLLSTATTNITMSVWANITSSSSRGCFFVNGNNNGYAIGVGGGLFEFYGNEIIALYGLRRWINTGINYGLGWKNIVLVVDSSSVPSIYLNGKLIGTYSGIGPLTPTTSAYVGREIFEGPQSPNRAFDGNIGQVLFYNRALSTSEILQNYNSTKQRYIYNQPINSSGLLLGLDFSDNLTYTGLGNTVFDLSPNVYKGTLTNGPKFTNDRNGGIIFDGVDDQINFSSNLANITYDNFSFEFVAKPSTTITTSAESTSGIAGSSGKRYIIEPTNEGSNGGFGVALGTNAVECIEHGGSYLPVLLSYSANLSDVNHYCVVVNNKRSKLYINGEYIKDGLQSPRPNSVARNTATLGFMYYGNYAGTLYEYNFYNRVLSANEIKSSFEINRGKYGIKNNRDRAGVLLDLDFSNRVCYPGTGNTIYDQSGVGITGNSNNGAVFSYENKGYFSFDGNSQNIVVDSSGAGITFTNTSDYNISAWIYVNSTQVRSFPSIIEKYNGTGGYPIAIRYSTSDFRIYSVLYDGTNGVSVGNTAVLNTWNCVSFNHNLSKKILTMYVNGKLAATTNYTTLNNISSSSSTRLGFRGFDSNTYFTGRISDVKIYNKILTSTEINNYYLSTKDRFFVDSQDIRDGLILDLDANNVDSYPGGNTWLDTSGSGTTARMIGNNYFIRGRSNNSFSLSGSDAYFTLGTVPNIDGYQLPLTLFGWFYMNNISGNQSVCGIYNGTSIIYNYLRIDGGTFRFFLSIDGVLYPGINAGQYQYFDYSTSLVANNWYNFAIVIGGTLTSPTLTIYINNKPQTFSPVNLKSSVTLNQDYRIGANQSNSQFLVGFISQFKLFNRTLSASEINTLFQNTRSRYGI